MDIAFSHLVEVNEAQRKLVIYRQYQDGRRELFTSVEMPVDKAAGEAKFADFCRLLGENLLLDSPSARRILRL